MYSVTEKKGRTGVFCAFVVNPALFLSLQSEIKSIIPNLIAANHFRDHKVLASRQRLGTQMRFLEILPGGGLLLLSNPRR